MPSGHGLLHVEPSLIILDTNRPCSKIVRYFDQREVRRRFEVLGMLQSWSGEGGLRIKKKYESFPPIIIIARYGSTVYRNPQAPK